MADPNSIKELFQSMSTPPNEILTGVVESVSPLRIRSSTDDKLIITGHNAVIPRHLTNYTVPAIISGAQQSITVQNALAVGDCVYILCVQRGKRFFVLDKLQS